MTQANDPQAQAAQGEDVKPAEGQDPTATSETGQAPEVAHDVDGLAARLAKIEAENKKLREEAAAKRIKAKEAEAAKLAELEKAGEFEKLNQGLKARVAELEAAAEKAARWDSYVESETERLNAKAETLTDWQRETFDALPDLSAKSRFLENVTKQNTPQPKPAVPNASAAPANQRQASDLTPAEISDLRRNNPQELARLFYQQNQNAGKPASSIAAMMRKITG